MQLLGSCASVTCCAQAYKDACDADPAAVDFKNITDPLAVSTLLIHYFAELPEQLKEGITAHFASSYDDVYRVAFGSDDAAAAA